MGKAGQQEDEEPLGLLWLEQTPCGHWLPWCRPPRHQPLFWWRCFEKLAVAPWSSALRDPHERMSGGGPWDAARV